ncbi:MAG: cytidyltransferase [Pseudomonadota bacterium]
MPAADSMAVTGRFQPFHRDHLDLVRYALTRRQRVVIGITNPDRRSLKPESDSRHRHLPGANPFSYFQRMTMIVAALDESGIARDRFRIVPFPLDCAEVWAGYIPLDATQLVRVYSGWEREKARKLRDGGYSVEVLHGDPATRISASDIRRAMQTSGSWQPLVPAAVSRYCRDLDLTALLAP